MYKLWERYVEETGYASDYSFEDVLATVEKIGMDLNLKKE